MAHGRRVLQVLVDEGAQVSNGDELLRMETDERQVALEQAQASERQAAARLGGCAAPGAARRRSWWYRRIRYWRLRRPTCKGRRPL
ncbi:biotin/lipoyl-binding protein [Accumulibacter sp.]|uniref:biotin/lipoyl-binding protein n=1 Tax=Accumulibacter sp. TaxID=2053492 RepID=UPI001AC65D32|nr:biotin/lipoyl-binding protein [Accumulibacter sp.]MBN8456166.1 biotin/lipoyl-binding protein [Accumulibacter sp.]MBO3708202.1 biotin/lipoyl-binding protein [Candidatus Accumulibacter conexus]